MIGASEQQRVKKDVRGRICSDRGEDTNEPEQIGHVEVGDNYFFMYMYITLIENYNNIKLH